VGLVGWWEGIGREEEEEEDGLGALEGGGRVEGGGGDEMVDRLVSLITTLDKRHVTKHRGTEQNSRRDRIEWNRIEQDRQDNKRSQATTK